jgi:hypothetical protein
MRKWPSSKLYPGLCGGGHISGGAPFLRLCGRAYQKVLTRKFIDLPRTLVRPGIADSNSNLLIGIGTIFVTQLCSYLLLDTVHRQR